MTDDTARAAFKKWWGANGEKVACGVISAADIWLAAWSRAPAQDDRADAVAEGRRQGLEEAAKLAETKFCNATEFSVGTAAHEGGKDIATALRALIQNPPPKGLQS